MTTTQTEKNKIREDIENNIFIKCSTFLEMQTDKMLKIAEREIQVESSGKTELLYGCTVRLVNNPTSEVFVTCLPNEGCYSVSLIDAKPGMRPTQSGFVIGAQRDALLALSAFLFSLYFLGPLKEIV